MKKETFFPNNTNILVQQDHSRKTKINSTSLILWMKILKHIFVDSIFFLNEKKPTYSNEILQLFIFFPIPCDHIHNSERASALSGDK